MCWVTLIFLAVPASLKGVGGDLVSNMPRCACRKVKEKVSFSTSSERNE